MINLYLIYQNPAGVCYAYDSQTDRYETARNTKNNFQWNWQSTKVKYINHNGVEKIKKYDNGIQNDETKKWELIGPMGPNVLFNKDGIVFSTPLARSFQNPCYKRGESRSSCKIPFGSESGTIILKSKDKDEFIIADGKWRKTGPDNLQGLAGTSFTKGKFYGVVDTETDSLL